MPEHDRIDRRNYGVDLLLRHSGEDRQGNTAGVAFFCSRKVPGTVAVSSPVERMQVQRNKMHAGADAGMLQFLDELGACDSQQLGTQPQDVQVPGVFGVRRLGWRKLQFLDGAESVVVPDGDRLPLAIKAVALCQ